MNVPYHQAEGVDAAMDSRNAFPAAAEKNKYGRLREKKIFCPLLPRKRRGKRPQDRGLRGMRKRIRWNLRLSTQTPKLPDGISVLPIQSPWRPFRIPVCKDPSFFHPDGYQFHVRTVRTWCICKLNLPGRKPHSRINRHMRTIKPLTI